MGVVEAVSLIGGLPVVVGVLVVPGYFPFVEGFSGVGRSPRGPWCPLGWGVCKGCKGLREPSYAAHV